MKKTVKKNTRFYETTFIVDALLEDEKVDKIIDHYTKFLKKNNAEVVNVEKWGRRKLAYPIKKRLSGSYVTLEVISEPSVISKLERAYNLDEDILRYLTVSFDKKTLIERNAYLEKKEQILREREAQALQSAEADSTQETDTKEKV